MQKKMKALRFQGKGEAAAFRKENQLQRNLNTVIAVFTLLPRLIPMLESLRK
jgi:hypothetical protein